jgi:hypothetical protein
LHIFIKLLFIKTYKRHYFTYLLMLEIFRTICNNAFMGKKSTKTGLIGANMKKYTALFIATVLAVFCFGAYLETFTGDWTTIRSAVATDDIIIDGSTATKTCKFTDKATTAIALSERTNAGEMYFYGTAAADKTAVFYVWAYKRNGPARLLYQGTITTGTAVTGTTNTYYCDTIAETTNNNSCTVIDSGNNRVAILNLGDLRGYSWLDVRFDVTVASEMATVNCDFTAY